MTRLSILIATDRVVALVANSKNESVVPLYVTKFDGYFEVDPQAIWNSVTKCVKTAMREVGISETQISEIEISSELDVTALWDNETLGSVCAARGDSKTSEQRLAWLLEHNPSVAGTLAAGRLASGSVTDYLVTRMTRGLFSDASGIGMRTEPSGFLGITAEIIA